MLTLKFRKKQDGAITFTCIRADGTATGQRAGDFFLHHDLGHYVIETTLGLNSAFYGMVARGWDFDDFGSPWPRGKFPEDAAGDLALAEAMAGMLDYERFGLQMTADEVNSSLADFLGQANLPMVRTITEADLNNIRQRHGELLQAWQETPIGGALELPFPLVSDTEG